MVLWCLSSFGEFPSSTALIAALYFSSSQAPTVITSMSRDISDCLAPGLHQSYCVLQGDLARNCGKISEVLEGETEQAAMCRLFLDNLWINVLKIFIGMSIKCIFCLKIFKIKKATEGGVVS